MFEKDAVEYREKGKNEGYYQVTQDMEQEALDYIIDESFKDGAEFGYNKANEWHYVKDGNPEELQDVLCFVIHNEHRYFLQGYLRDGRWVLSPLGTYLNNEDVIAWKEIVPPELPKENE